MSDEAYKKYREVMQVIRQRFDLVEALRHSTAERFTVAETAAFNGRKIVEGVAYGCLITLEHGLDYVPRDVRGHYSAAEIFKFLEKKKLGTAFPSPGIIRQPSKEEIAEQGVLAATVEGKPERRLTIAELIEIYTNLHRWNHELNPYVERDREKFLERYENGLWGSLSRVWLFLERHAISIHGQMFLCVLRDKVDGAVKVVRLSKEYDSTLKNSTDA